MSSVAKVVNSLQDITGYATFTKLVPIETRLQVLTLLEDR